MGLLDQFKTVVEVVQKADNIDLYRKVLDLQKEALDLVAENQALRQKVRELETAQKTAEGLIFDDNELAYFQKLPEGQREGPFCALCRDRDRKLVRKSQQLAHKTECPFCFREGMRATR